MTIQAQTVDYDVLNQAKMPTLEPPTMPTIDRTFTSLDATQEWIKEISPRMHPQKIRIIISDTEVDVDEVEFKKQTGIELTDNLKRYIEERAELGQAEYERGEYMSLEESKKRMYAEFFSHSDK